MNWLKQPISSIYLAFMLVLSLAVLSPNLIAVLAPLPVLLCLGLNLPKLRAYHLSSPILLMFLAAVILAAISSYFGGQYESLADAAKATLLIIGFIVMDNYLADNKPYRQFSEHELKIIIVLFGLVSLLCIYQVVGDHVVKYLITGQVEQDSRLNDFLVAILVCSWLFLALLVNNNNRYYKYLVLLIIPPVLYGPSASTQVALLVSIVGFITYMVLKNRFRLLLKAAILLSLVMIICLPGLLIERYPESELIANMAVSALHRLDIWDRCVDLIQQSPWVGWGTSIPDLISTTEQHAFFSQAQNRNQFLYPHNVLLQITIELGLLGLVLFLFLLNHVINRIENLHKDYRGYAYACFIAIYSVWMFSISLWRSWWLSLLFMSVLFFRLLSAQNNANKPNRPTN